MVNVASRRFCVSLGTEEQDICRLEDDGGAPAPAGVPEVARQTVGDIEGEIHYTAAGAWTQFPILHRILWSITHAGW